MEEEGFSFRIILLIKNLIHINTVGVGLQEITGRIQFGKELGSIPEVTEGLGA